jgi:hypothetical protein
VDCVSLQWRNDCHRLKRIGFAGWVRDIKSCNRSARKKSEGKTHLPQTLDVIAWQEMSKGLMRERRRALDSLYKVLRKK